jgi:hypothetical protein
MEGKVDDVWQRQDDGVGAAFARADDNAQTRRGASGAIAGDERV